jgi:DNA excision repair protein ERCC-4
VFGTTAKKGVQMVIVIDTREQTPFVFPEGVQTVGGTLQSGDYSLQGFTDLVTIERKSLPDMVGCIGQGRERFERELIRLRGYRYKAVVIEANLKQCEAGGWYKPVTTNGKPKKGITPAQLLGSIASWRVKYGVEFIYACNAEYGANETYRLLRKFYDYMEDFIKRLK